MLGESSLGSVLRLDGSLLGLAYVARCVAAPMLLRWVEAKLEFVVSVPRLDMVEWTVATELHVAHSYSVSPPYRSGVLLRIVWSFVDDLIAVLCCVER